MGFVFKIEEKRSDNLQWISFQSIPDSFLLTTMEPYHLKKTTFNKKKVSTLGAVGIAKSQLPRRL